MNGNRGQIPNLQELQAYAVNRKGQYEGIRQSLFDFQVYASGGQTSLAFFQVPIGQGGKTIDDTNMEIQGALPQPKHHLTESIELRFFPGVLPVTLVSGAGGTIVASNFTNDVYTFHKSGSLRYFIGSKAYLEESPLGRFPPKTKLESEFAVALAQNQTVAADLENRISMDISYMNGRPYFINPATLLIPVQNFNVTTLWATAVALPSGQDARIGAVNDGVLYRQSQ